MTHIKCYRKYCLYREALNDETLEDNTYNTCRLRDIVISNSGKCQDYDDNGQYLKKKRLRHDPITGTLSETYSDLISGYDKVKTP